MEPSIYIMGGKKFDGSRTDKIEVFNPQTMKTKILKSRMPTPRSGFAAIAIGPRIIILGGNNGQVMADVDIYDTVTEQWEKMASLRKGRDELAVCLGPDNKIYAVGGYGGKDK